VWKIAHMNEAIESTQRRSIAIDVSVVIPALNVAETIGQQLDALVHQDFIGDWEVIVADNGSTDATRAVVETFAGRLPSLRIIDASARKGVNHARNAGTRVARGRLVLYCDGDDIVFPNWVSEMTAALHTHDAIGGRVHRFGRPGVKVAFDPVTFNSTFLSYPFGANCGVKRDIWLRLGGFNEDYDGRAGDEVEFFWRLQLAGYGLGHAPDAIVRYRLPAKHDIKKSFRNGREAVRLYRDFRESGYPGPNVGALRGWARIISRAPLALISATRRSMWLRMVARHLGRAVGSIKYRHMLL